MSGKRSKAEEDIRIFICYRAESVEQAKNIKLAMEEQKELDFGKVWLSDLESKGNFQDDIPKCFSAAEYAILFIGAHFTAGFLKEDGSINRECITAQEIIEIEKRRQSNQLYLVAVNIDGNSLNEEDGKILEKLFEQAGIKVENSVSSYLYLNQNVYNSRQTKPKVFIKDRLANLAKVSPIAELSRFDETTVKKTAVVTNASTNRKNRLFDISTLIEIMQEGDQRFCFILGAGASITSGIPESRMLEKRWMDFLMGCANDGRLRPRNPSATENNANRLFEDGLLYWPFKEIKKAWEYSCSKGGYIPSEYFHDIYLLRFYPNARRGIKYFDQLVDRARPSVGYHPLARLLAEETGIDIVITTNYDSLTEDALFLYTEKRPLVISHESFADRIDYNDMKRPVVMKLPQHFFQPINDRGLSSELSEGWKEALGEIFMQYTPIVIGYAGGDRSLMSFLEEKSTRLRHGLYWCLMKDEVPEERIEKLVAAKDGCFVEINGFDDAMLAIGEKFLGESLIPTKTIELLNKSAKERGEEYDRQWTEWEKRRQKENAEHEEGIAKLIKAQVKDENEREARGVLTAGDHLRRGNRAYDDGNFGEALAEYSRAIELKPDYADAYYNRGNLYGDMGEKAKAIADLNRAIELKPDDADAYNNRGILYRKMGEREKAMADYNRAIELKPDNAEAYNNRGNLYRNMGEKAKAMADYSRAIELKPDNAEAYNNRGVLYDDMGEQEKAMADYNRAIELKSNYAKAYNNRGLLYRDMGEKAKAEADFDRAAELEKKKK